MDRVERPARALVLLLALAIACQPVAPGPPSASSAPPSPSAKVAVGGTLRIALATDAGPLDPLAPDANTLVVGQVFEGLVAAGANGARPRLAEKWRVAPDGRTWTFTLRAGVVFHDGVPLDARAAARSLSRRANDPLIESASADADGALVVATRMPFGPFLSALAARPYAIVSPGSPAAGTGPFRARAAAGAAPLVLERNDRYWRTDGSGQRLPYLDALSFTTIADPAARLAALRSGAADVAFDLALSDVTALRADPSLQLVPQAPATVLYLGLNLSRPPLDDLRVRQAIASAVNARTLVDRLYAGEGRPASQFPPPTMLGSDDSVTEFAKTDSGAAKRLLVDAGHPSFEIELWYLLGAPSTQPDMRRVAESVAADLAAVGISAEPKTIDAVTFASNVRNNRYPMWLATATPVPPDPDVLLGAFFNPPTTDGQDQPTEGGAWVNREVAGLLRKAFVETDETKRAELYKQVSKIVQREIPRIPLVWSAPPVGASRKLQNAAGEFFAETALGK